METVVDEYLQLGKREAEIMEALAAFPNDRDVQHHPLVVISRRLAEIDQEMRDIYGNTKDWSVKEAIMRTALAQRRSNIELLQKVLRDMQSDAARHRSERDDPTAQ